MSASIYISSTVVSLSITREGELTLGDVVEEFLPGNSFVDTTGASPKLRNWPPFLPDPLSIALVNFDLKATRPNSSWELTTMNMKLRLNQEIPLFAGKIRIKDLELDLNYKGGKDSSFSGEVLGKIEVGPKDKHSPRVDVRIPFPFKNEEISFTFSDFTVTSVVEALSGKSDLFPTDFKEVFSHIQLDKIAIAFNQEGSVKTISVDASIPGVWNIFGSLSIEDVTIHFEYGKSSNTEDTADSTENTDGGNPTTDTAGAPSNASPPDWDTSTALLLTDQQATKSKWRIVVKGKIVIATCTIKILADLGSERVEVTADGARCSVSIGDLMEKFGRNGINLPSLISGFTIFNPKVQLIWQRTKDNPGKSLAFTATTSLFHESHVRKYSDLLTVEVHDMIIPYELYAVVRNRVSVREEDVFQINVRIHFHSPDCQSHAIIVSCRL